VEEYAPFFQDCFENICQYRHFENYLTGLITLPNKTMTNISRCILNSADKTNLSRFFSQAPWEESAVNDRRLELMLTETASKRLAAKHSALIIDDTMCEHVGSLFDFIDHHYNHTDSTFPLAHNVINSYYVSGPVRFPVNGYLYRRFEEITHWPDFVNKHFPEVVIPSKSKERAKLHEKLAPTLLQDPEFAALNAQFNTKIDLAVKLVEDAVAHQVPFEVLLMDSWFLCPELSEAAKRHQKDWISILKSNRNLETNSFTLKDEAGQPVVLNGPHISVAKLLPLIPPTAYQAVEVNGKTYWCFTLTVRIPSLGKVRLVISQEKRDLSGRCAVLVSNRTAWSAKEIVSKYLLRWPIETFYQDSKQQLGFNEYRMRSAEAFGKHWCLVYVAYSLLHLECLRGETKPLSTSAVKSEEEKALLSEEALKILPAKSIGQVCREQARSLMESLILKAHDLLAGGQTVQAVFDFLFAKQSLPCTLSA
jgi:hypothetical protein